MSNPSNNEERNKYIESYIPKITALAKQLTSDIDMQEELFSAGMLGVTIACKNYTSLVKPNLQIVYGRVIYEMTKTCLISRGSTTIRHCSIPLHSLQDLINGTNLTEVASKLGIEKGDIPQFINSLTDYGSSNYLYVSDSELQDLNHDDSLESWACSIDIEQIIITLFERGDLLKEDVQIISYTFGLLGYPKLRQADIARLPEFSTSRSYINYRLKRALQIVKRVIEYPKITEWPKENQPKF